MVHPELDPPRRNHKLMSHASLRRPSSGSVRKPALSPTKIGLFLECAVKYRYVYIDRIGRFYLRSSPGLSFGATLHQVLQQFHAQGATQTLEAMQNTVDSKWIAAGYETAEQEAEHHDRALELVSAYHAAYQQKTEIGTVTLFTEKTISWDFTRFRLTGRVDRIDQHPDGTLEVIDYKSGRSDVTARDVAGSLAMNCYQLILHHLYPDSAIRGTIYSLKSGVSATSALDGDARARFQTDIEQIGARILDTNWDVVRPVPIEICSECEFLSRCRTYWRSLERARSAGEFSEDGL
jgi:putative RecB family exonuclease